VRRIPWSQGKMQGIFADSAVFCENPSRKYLRIQ